MSRRFLVKVCGQTNAEDAAVALSCGADFLGFIFHPSSPRCVTPQQAAAIPTGLCRRVGVFVRTEVREIAEIARTARLDLLQLHGPYSAQDAAFLGPERIIRVLWPEKTPIESLQAQIDAWASFCAYYLTDAGSAAASGGLGRCLDVASLDRLRFPHPWFLAGGLSPSNLPRLLSLCHPNGIDLNSGVELSPGRKDPTALRAVFGLPLVGKIPAESPIRLCCPLLMGANKDRPSGGEGRS